MATQFEGKLGKETNTPNWGNYSSLDMYLAKHRGKLARFRSLMLKLNKPVKKEEDFDS